MDKYVVLGIIFLIGVSVMAALYTPPSVTGFAVTSFERSKPAPQVARCHDTDGGINAWVPGRTLRLPARDDSGMRDSCTGTLLTEYYCVNSSIAKTEIACEVGCREARCIRNESKPKRLACEDSDKGFDPTRRGTVVSVSNVSLVRSLDRCADANMLIEFGCENGVLANRTIPCVEGCLEGRCKNRTIHRAVRCFDSDYGDNPLERGLVIVSTPSGLSRSYDYCQNPSLLNEFFCVDDVLRNESVACAEGCLEGRCKLNRATGKMARD